MPIIQCRPRVLMQQQQISFQTMNLLDQNVKLPKQCVVNATMDVALDCQTDLKAVCNLGAHVPGPYSPDVQIQVRHTCCFAQQILALAGREVFQGLHWRKIGHLNHQTDQPGISQADKHKLSVSHAWTYALVCFIARSSNCCHDCLAQPTVLLPLHFTRTYSWCSSPVPQTLHAPGCEPPEPQSPGC